MFGATPSFMAFTPMISFVLKFLTAGSFVLGVIFFNDQFSLNPCLLFLVDVLELGFLLNILIVA